MHNLGLRQKQVEEVHIFIYRSWNIHN